MKLLAFDTATEVCSVALWIDGVVHERIERGSRHAEKFLILVDEVLAAGGVALSNLDAIAFGRGPGSFTGLRLSAGVAQGVAFAADLPVVPVSSLAAIAQAIDASRVLAAIDARMQQVYWGEYVRQLNGTVQLIGEERVIAPSDVPLPSGNDWTGAGSGWDQYTSSLERRLNGRIVGWQRGVHPHAGAIARLGAEDFAAGRAVAPEQALPIYIRDDVAMKKPPVA